MTARRFPILDNHLHLQPEGRNVEAVKDFLRAGGTHVCLAHLPQKDIPINAGSDFGRAYQRTLAMAERVRKETEATVFVAVGPYPAELLELAKRHGMERAEALMKEGMDEAARLAREGKIVAIGEIGRPHFPVSDEIWDASNRILLHGMEAARDADCPVVLHTESAGPEVFLELAKMADEAGLAREKVIKHFSPPLVDVEKNAGLFPSVLAGKNAIETALPQGHRFLMETDYIDDPNRPGAVLGPKTIPKRTLSLFEAGQMSEEAVFKVHKDNPEKLYGVKIELK